MSTTDDALDHEQRARAQALQHARDVLAAHSVGGRSSVDVLDVLHLADWIVTGTNPFNGRGYVGVGWIDETDSEGGT